MTRAKPSKKTKKEGPGFVSLPGSQALFIAETTFEVLLEGTRGGGKSIGMLMAFAVHVGKGYGPAWAGAIFRLEYPQLEDIMKKSLTLFPAIFGNACTYNKGRHEWVWDTGEKLMFRHGIDETDYLKYHGSELPFLGFEELTNWNLPNFYLKMFSCCRSGEFPEMPRIIRATTNPSGPGMQWVKKRFRLPESRFEPFTEKEQDQHGKWVDSAPRMAIFSHYRENSFIMENDPNYERTLRASASSEAELKAWMSGDWNVALGGLFSDIWDAKVHVIAPFKIPAGWRLFRCLDWGSSRPFAYGLFAESNGEPVIDTKNLKVYGAVKGDLFLIAEWYGSTGKTNEGLNLTDSAVGEGIKARETEWQQDFGFRRHQIRPGPADHNIFARDRGPTIHSIYNKYGVKFVPADKGPFSRKRGWSVMREYLFNATREERSNKQPGLWLFNTCHHGKVHLPATTRDEKDPDDTSLPEDHFQDMVRYGVRRIKNILRQSDG